MIILHVSEFSLTPRSLHWLVHDAPPHHLLAVSGNVAPGGGDSRTHASWLAWLNEDGLREYRRPVAFCGGRTESVWARAWRPSVWWRRPVSAPGHVWSAGDAFVMGGLSFWVASREGLARAMEADVWIVRDPFRAGDPASEAAIARHRPRFVLCGAEVDPERWCVRRGPTLVLNPGIDPSSPVPPHILIDTRRRELRRSTGAFVGAERLAFDAVPPSVLRRETTNPVLA